MKQVRNKKTRKKKLIFLIVGFFVISGLTLLFLEKTKVTNFYEKPSNQNGSDNDSEAVPETAGENFTGGDERDPGNTDKEDEGYGSIEDSGGMSNVQTDSSKWTASASGEIVVHTPYSNQVIKSGEVISGTSSLPKVSYRLIDEVSGVISQGQLNVVSGKFSGKISFSTAASEGRIDFFGEKEDGREFSNVEVAIKYGQ